jgi:hypothetical protein
MSASVNVPVNPERRDHDIDSMLRLYGIIYAFSIGKLPSNEQIDVSLSSLTSHKKLRNPNEKLSAEGKELLAGFQTVVEEAKRLILIKNYDQALQGFIWNTAALIQKGGPQIELPNVPIDSDTSNRDAEAAMNGLNTLGRLLITNGQFRKLLSDATILLRDIAGDAATHTAARINPTEVQLRQINLPAADHEWHDAPDFSKENIKNRFRGKTNQNKPVSRGEMRDISEDATQSGVDVQTGLRTGTEDLAQKLEENIPEEQKQRVRDYRDQTRNYLQSKMPQDRREQVILRLKKMIVEIQSQPDYAVAIDSLLHLAETYSGHGINLASESAGTVKGAHSDNHLQTTEKYLQTLLERFANNTSLDDLIDAINSIYRDADNDPQLKNWFRSVDTYIRKCLKQQGYILQDESTAEYRKLYDQGNSLLRNRYRDHTDRLMDEVKFMAEQFSVDQDNRRFGDALQKLFNDLGTDSDGKTVLKKHLLKDISQVIIPDIFESVSYVPIPRIEYSDPQFDAVVENLVLEGDNLMPNIFEIGNDSYLRFGRKSISNKKKTQFMISASQIQCDLRDISYYVRRKKGFPSITDTGVADIFLGGDGLGFRIQLSTAEKTDRAHFFKVDHISISITHLKIKLKQSSHKTLFSVIKPLLLRIMKPVIIKVLEKQIRNTFYELDAFCYRVYQEEQNIERQLKTNPGPENTKSIYYRYYQALQKERFSRRKAAEAKTQEKHAKIAITAEDSMFKEVKLPGGVSIKAMEYKKMASTGDRWLSDVFSIGRSSTTTGLPQPVTVARKSPYAHRTIKDRDTTSSDGQSRDSGYQGHEGIAGHGNDGYGEKYGNQTTLNKTTEESCRYTQPATFTNTNGVGV